ncbi:Pyrimidine-specific ribonucleoside hydrolase RihB [bacterium HR17]|jgi:inosine-uridine nucleoside N-ribohydrolase|uniref:Pyrimidine-specific ribonucleoside hydrolase RihB n=1 Tax=Candidatus Fervidibacter japonicus TaxID=2035412 RepID=A0A2H5XA75_9BACT|nr:Pyrimidine-specific ribonucleoside hydrolase RihB [bacterium HR17]
MAFKLLIDTDIGDNVDDAFALVVAARLTDVELVGVTTVGSATTLRAQLAHKVLGVCGAGTVPVAAGCAQPLVAEPQRHFPDQASVLETLDRVFVPPANGVDFLRETVRRYPGEVVIVTLGALTNLALALRIEPGLARLINKVVMMAGADTLARPETNARRDPEALHIVVNSPVPFVMVSKDITQHAAMPSDMLDRLRTHTAPWCTLLWRLTLIWQRSANAVAPVLNDPLAVAVAVLPDMAQRERCRVAVELRGDHTRGCTCITVDPTGNGEIVRAVHWPSFWALVERTLFG